MRITLSLDPDVARQLKARVAQQKRSVNRVVNEALRAGFAGVEFSVEAHSSQFKFGIDVDKLNQRADETEAEGLRNRLLE